MKLIMENFNKFLAEVDGADEVTPDEEGALRKAVSDILDDEPITLDNLLGMEEVELGEKLLDMARPDWKDDKYFYIRDHEMAALLDDALTKLSLEDQKRSEEHEGDFHRALEEYVENHANKVGTSRQSPEEEEGETSSEEEKTTRDKILDVVDRMAGRTEASEEGTAALQDALVEIGFEKEDMSFNEYYPASLSFGNDWGELGEWVLKLEGKCLKRGDGACLEEN